MYQGLSLNQAPPLRVPFRFFLTAPLFAATAHFLLAWSGANSCLTRWNTSQLAATHLYVLGFLTMTIFGALFQLLPVVVGEPIQNAERTASIVHIFLIIGTSALALAFLGVHPIFFVLAALCLVFSVGLFLKEAGRVLFRSQANYDNILTIRLSLSALAVAILLALTMIFLTLKTDYSFRPLISNAHATIGLLGWIFLLIFGVSLKIVPMFFVTLNYPRFFETHFPRLFYLLIFLKCLTLLTPTSSLLKTFFASIGVGTNILISLCLGGFSVATLLLLKNRSRKAYDVSFLYWGAGVMFLLLIVLLYWLGPMISIHCDSDQTIGMLLLYGSFTSIVTAMYFKIVPFLAWLHLQPYSQHPKVQDRSVRLPYMNAFLSEIHCRFQFGVFIISWIVLGLSFWIPKPFYYIGHVAAATSFLLLWIIVFRAYRTHINYLKKTLNISL